MAYKRKTEAQTAFDAEQRAVEEGRRAFFVTYNGKPAIKVVSDTSDRKYYVTAYADARGVAIFECYSDDPNFKHASSGKPIPCKHAALAARRLEREGIVMWYDGLWWVKPEFLPSANNASIDLDQLAKELEALA